MEDMDKMKEDLSFKEILNKMARYCAYQERSSGDVHNKLKRYELPKEMLTRIMNKLEHEGFINDERYCQSYVNGKLRNNNWGRVKITLGLRERGIDEANIEKALEKINEELYRGIIHKLISSKSRQLKDMPFIKKNKIARFLHSRGFENTVIWEELENFEF